jgi:hypothetical protein
MNANQNYVLRFRSLLLITIFVCYPLLSFGQENSSSKEKSLNTEIRPIEYIEVIQADGLKKDQLYSAALAWFSETFRSAKNVFDVQDREAGRIVGKPLFQYEPTVFIGSARIRGVVRYSVTVEVKDGRYRYNIGSFVHDGTPGQYGGPASFGLLTTAIKCPYSIDGPTSSGAQETWEDLSLRARIEADHLISSLKSHMEKAKTLQILGELRG